MISFYHHIPSLWCGGTAMNGLNPSIHSHFLQEGAPRNPSEIKFLANPRSLLDVIEWLVGIQECLECHDILLPSYTKPLMWWYSYEWPQPIYSQPFFTRRCAQESVRDQIFANPRSLLDVIEWLVGIQECLECHNILLPSWIPSLWCGGTAMNGLNPWPQPIYSQPFFTRRCAQESVRDQIFG